MKIKTWRDPYETGFSPTTPTEIELNKGLTVLVGCNGAGKSTLLHNIEEHCKQNKIPCYKYDNLKDGGSTAFESLFYEGNYTESMSLFYSSEGECIKSNIYRESGLFKDFLQTGVINNKKNKFFKAFSNSYKVKELEDAYNNCKDRVFLFDAVDSGLSVDSIVEIKEMFNAILNDTDKFDVNIYLIITANEYELARKSQCFDVNTGKYIEFNDYEDYRTFIIKSRVRKEKRIEKQKAWFEKQKQKEIDSYRKLKEKCDKDLKALLDKYGDKSLSFSEKRKLKDINDKLKDFIRDCRYNSKEDFENL